MLGKAIRKAVLPILLASLMVGPGAFCSFNGSQHRHCNLRKGSGHQAKSGKYYEDYDVDPDFRCVGEWYTENE